MDGGKVNILLVDDQPAKLLTYEAILRELGENLLTANGARGALEILLKNDVAVILVDVYMPETDGFELAKMIREHPRFRQTAIIFISAILLTDVDRLRGYEMGAVDYVPVPVIPEVLRAKVRVFVDLYRKTRQLEQLNRDLERRVAERTAELAESATHLRQSEQLRGLALIAGQMGCWEWDAIRKIGRWDQGQYTIFGVDPATFKPTTENVRPLIDREDLKPILEALRQMNKDTTTFQTEFRVRRPNGELRWCLGAAAANFDDANRLVRLAGITVDITDRKLAEERQTLLAEEVDHRARNVVTVVQSILRLTRADCIENYIAAVDGRIGALSNAHRLLAGSRWEGADLLKLVEEEIAPYRVDGDAKVSICGPAVLLAPAMAQTIALALHELVTNAAKYGALSTKAGHVTLTWEARHDSIELNWVESNGPKIEPPKTRGYGTRVFSGGIERQLGGVIDFDWHPDGLRCKLVIPRNKAKLNGLRIARAPVDGSTETAPDMLRKTILLVEDEPTVSMMLADMLSQLGHTIDGPYNRFSDAMTAARTNDVQAGVLDINVGGEKIYPLAEILTERNIPFVFVTGYSIDSIDSRFRHVPVLQKPVEPEALRAVIMGAPTADARNNRQPAPLISID
jgi:two-component sensor histidine kinase/DNA-binding response OmpR family regulator